MKSDKEIFMIAGPNGSGKTTTAISFISSKTMIDEFINADDIARALAPIDPNSMSLTASKLMIKRFKDLLEAGKSFAFETTASGLNYVKHLVRAKSHGYEVHLIFLWLNSPELAVKRVAHRVEQGGHSVPEETIKRRYYSGLKNLLKHYLPICDTALILDNSIAQEYKVIARKEINETFRIEEVKLWNEIQEVVNEKE